MSASFDLAIAWGPYASLMPVSSVAASLKDAVKMAGEPIVEVIPSIVLVADGPKVGSIFLFTNSLLCEVRLDGLSFDYVARKRVANMRWTFRREPAQIAEGKDPVIYDMAILDIRHPEGLSSQLVYVGEKRDEWVARVSLMIPASAVSDF